MSKNILTATQVSFYKKWVSRDAFFTSYFILCKNRGGYLVGAEHTICEAAFENNDRVLLVRKGIASVEKNLVGEISNKQWLEEDWLRRLNSGEEKD